MQELKMIIDLASKVTDDAFWIIVMYFTKDILETVLLFIGWGTLIFIFGKIIFKFVNLTYAIIEINNFLEEEKIDNFTPWFGPELRQFKENIINKLKNPKGIK